MDWRHTVPSSILFPTERPPSNVKKNCKRNNLKSLNREWRQEAVLGTKAPRSQPRLLSANLPSISLSLAEACTVREAVGRARCVNICWRGAPSHHLAIWTGLPVTWFCVLLPYRRLPPFNFFSPAALKCRASHILLWHTLVDYQLTWEQPSEICSR